MEENGLDGNLCSHRSTAERTQYSTVISLSTDMISKSHINFSAIIGILSRLNSTNLRNKSCVLISDFLWLK